MTHVTPAAGSSSQLRTLLEGVVIGSPEATLLVDPGGCISAANERVQGLFGHAPQELLGKPLTMLAAQRFRAVVLDTLAQGTAARAAGGGPGGKLTIWACSKDNRELPCELGMTRVAMPEGLYTLTTMVDVSAREHSAQAHHYLSALVEHAGDAIISKDVQGVIRSWNPAAEGLLGYRADEIVGQPVTTLIPEDRLAEEAMILERIRAGLPVAHLETVRRRRDGSLVCVDLTVSPVRDHNGGVVAASKIMRDITERRRAEEAIRQANDNLAGINRELADFVRTTSHDLRAPLLGIDSLVRHILEDDPTLCATTRERLGVIGGRATRLQRLLADLRDYARAGQFATPSGPRLSGAQLLAEVVAALHVPEGFEVVADPSLAGAFVNGIPLQSVLHNLVGNAIKHHDRSTGRVTVAARRDGKWIRFRVSDDGPGIPDDYHGIIFELFQTLRPRDEVEGSGMGLAMVRKFVTRMGGRCGIEPHGGRGAHFWFEWPTAHDERQE